MNHFLTRPLAAAAAASLAATLPAPALAQATDSVEAFAVLFEDPDDPPPPPSVLEVATLSSMSFNHIKIPGGKNPGSKCVYTLSVGALGFTGGYQEIDDAGGVIGTNSPDTTDCAWPVFDEAGFSNVDYQGILGIARPGLVVVECDKDRAVYYALLFQNGYSGVFFTAPPSGRTAAFEDDQQGVFSGGSGTGVVGDLQGSVTCRDKDNNGAAGLFFAIGGQLTVTENALPSEDATVGTIIFEASY